MECFGSQADKIDEMEDVAWGASGEVADWSGFPCRLSQWWKYTGNRVLSRLAVDVDVAVAVTVIVAVDNRSPIRLVGRRR